MSVATYIKDPGATLDYGVDWGSWLASGETIEQSHWAVTPAPSVPAVPGDLVVGSEYVSGGSTTAWVSGGTHLVSYELTNTITTSAGRTDSRSLTINCKNR